MLLMQILVFTACSNQPLIKNDDMEIKKGIESLINKGENKGIEISIRNKCTIDNKMIVSYSTSNEMFGYSVFEIKSKGFLKFGEVSYGTNIVNLPVISTNGGKYLFAIGQKYNKNIQYIKVNLEDKNYIFDISGESNFIQTYSVPHKTTANYGELQAILDNENNDISPDVKADNN